MEQAEKIAAVMALHKPEAQNNSMVYEVWHDSEVTLTKGGDLYRQRTLHCTLPADKATQLPPDSLVKSGHYSRIMVNSAEEANQAVEIIRGKCPYHTKWV
jgi:hypothetical protein